MGLCIKCNCVCLHVQLCACMCVCMCLCMCVRARVFVQVLCTRVFNQIDPDLSVRKCEKDFTITKV